MGANEKKKIVIAGASGFIGGHLIDRLSRNYTVVTLTRSPMKRMGVSASVVWDGKNQGDWAQVLDGAFAVINLSGKSVNCRFTEANKKAILDSRLDTTHAIGEAIEQCENPPSVWLNASGVSIYKESYDEPQSEASTETDNDFLADVTKQWEEACLSAAPNTRKVVMRTAVVLGAKEGSFPMIERLARFFLGGRQGSGKQYFSWIHIEDYCSVVENVLLSDASVSGPVNMSAPQVVTNSEFMKAVRKGVGRPFGFPAPEFLLKIGARIIGTEPSLVLKSTYVIPAVLIEKKAKFSFPEIDAAIRDLVARKKS